MRSTRFFFSILCVLVAALEVSCAAQTGDREQKKNPTKLLPLPADFSAPFLINAPPSQRVRSVAFLAPDFMTAPDRQLADSAMPILRQKAALAGFDLDRGPWTRQQMLCPVFPDHVLLLFTRNRGLGNLSMFSAVIPRAGENALFVVPILRRSETPYTPAPSNPRTIAIYNRIRAGENPGKKVDWLTAGLCYAALSGAHVELPPLKGSAAKHDVSLVMDSLLQLDTDGSPSVQFLDVEVYDRPREWDLSFDNKGNLLKVTVTPTPAMTPRLVPQ